MTDELFLAEGESQTDGPVAILRTFALHNRVKVLSGLAALSYVAGRHGDDEWDYWTEADDALVDAFHRDHGTALDSDMPRWQRRRAVKVMLSDAFRGGRAQREIDLAVAGRALSEFEDSAPRQLGAAKVCDRALGLARARATIYADEVEFPLDRHPHAIESEIGYVATKIAQRHPVTDAEAAYCALKAFEERGFDITFEAAAVAMERAAAGRADREAEEVSARERAADVESATANLFGGAE